MNTTKAEQIAKEIAGSLNMCWMDSINQDLLAKKVKIAIIQYSTEQNKELVEALRETKAHAMHSDDCKIVTSYCTCHMGKAAALLPQHSEKGEK